jgi:hypothetical protein
LERNGDGQDETGVWFAASFHSGCDTGGGHRAGGGGGWFGLRFVFGFDDVRGFEPVCGYKSGPAGAYDDGWQNLSTGHHNGGTQDAASEYERVGCEYEERT